MQALVESLILIAYVVWCIQLFTIEESGKILGKELRSARVINMEERNLLDEKDAVVAAEEQEHLRRETDRKFLVKCSFALVLICVLLVFVIFMLIPPIKSSRKKMDMMQAISNSKQIYLVLLDFENDYGNFPDDETEANYEDLDAFRGPHSNDYLGQLIAGGYTKSEEIFYAFDKRYSAKPDDVIFPREEILQKGECGFGYVMVEEKGKVRGLSTEDNGGLPVLVAPIVDESGVFEKKSLDGRGVYLRVDGSARNERLNSDNKIRVGPRTLFDTGADTVWGMELKPVLLLPER